MLKEGLFFKVVLPIVTAVFSGVGVLLFTPDWEATARAKGWASRAEWQAAARRENWLPNEECPAFPIAVQLTSPGDGAQIRVSVGSDYTTIRTDLVIRTSRPLPSSSSVGLVANEEGTGQYYLLFPSFRADERRAVFRKDDIYLPFKAQLSSKLNIWALVVAAEREYGSPYSSIEQIRAVRDDSVISQKATVSLKGGE